MIAIMQPYFMPYLGYLQLMAEVDKFVIYDDVNYINRGWINRNNILVNGQKTMLTVPLNGASQNKKINEIDVAADDKWKNKMLRTIEMSYKRSPYFEQVFELFNSIVFFPEKGLSNFLSNSLIKLSHYLDLKSEIIQTSTSFRNEHLKKGDRLIDICHLLDDLEYLNPIGGAEIYTKDEFAEKGVKLRFLEMTSRPYPQNQKGDFVGYLSILDVLMMNAPDFIKQELLKDFKIY